MEIKLRHSDVSTPHRKARRNPHSPVLKRSTLEIQFWNCLREIARSENIAVDTLVKRIDTDRTRHSLSSAVRLFVLDYFRMRTNRETSADLTASGTGPVLEWPVRLQRRKGHGTRRG